VTAPAAQPDRSIRSTIRMAMIRQDCPVAPDAADDLLNIYRGEVRREAAAEQRSALLSEGYDLSCRCDGCTACLVRYAITAIDPASDYYEDVEL